MFGSVQCLSNPYGSRQPQHKTKKVELTQNNLFDFRITDVDWVGLLYLVQFDWSAVDSYLFFVEFCVMKMTYAIAF